MAGLERAQTPSWSSSVQAARLPGPGDVIAERYKLAEELGRGGMGIVYAAEDLKLGRRVAVKLVRPGTQAPDAVQRFEREARAAASLQHANVVAIHDAGVHGDCPYLVAEFLRGTTLRVHLQKGRLPLRQALSFGMLVARGLGAAHDHGIVHRDLKPENVFITDQGWPKLVDFGIAKLRSEDPESITSSESSDRTVLEPLTAEGSFVGTVGYASPEQVRGQPADARSDVFSFGAVLYEMICGERAFSGATRFDTCFAIVNGQPRPLSREVPEALCQLVDRCLKKDPAERFQSAVEVGASLDAISEQLGVTDPALRYPHAAPTQALMLGGGRAKALVAAVIVLAGAAAGLALRNRREPPMSQPLSSRLEALPRSRPDRRKPAPHSGWARWRCGEGR